MKAKLIKKENNYYLTTEKQTSLCYHLGYKELLEVKGVGEKSGEVHHNKGWNKTDEVMFIDTEAKLSKQNCDELFGVVDVEKLFNEVYETIDFHEFCFTSFKLGFNKAMELNKDKVFTLEDMRKAIAYGESVRDMDEGKIPYKTFVKFIQSLQQPSEIDVEIDMEEAQEIYRDGTIKNIRVPKLDSEGCLILKRVIC